MLKNRQSGKREKGIQTASPFLFRIKGEMKGKGKKTTKESRQYASQEEKQKAK